MRSYNMNLLKTSSRRAMLAATILCVGQAAARADTLSSNLSSATADTEVVSGSTWVAGGITTDVSSYQLSSATLLLSNSIAGAATLDVYSGVAQPDSLIGTLTSPGAYSL